MRYLWFSVMLLSALPVHAFAKWEKTVDAVQVKKMIIKNYTGGKINVETHEQSTVIISSKRTPKKTACMVDVQRKGETLVIKTTNEKASCRLNLQVTVPEQVAVQHLSGRGDVILRYATLPQVGHLNVQTTKGDIRVELPKDSKILTNYLTDSDEMQSNISNSRDVQFKIATRTDEGDLSIYRHA